MNATKMLLLAGLTAGLFAWQAPARAEATIPIIVKDTTSQYWQIVLAGARKAGQEPTPFTHLCRCGACAGRAVLNR